MASDDDLIGKVEEKVGWLTGDREAEAKGKLRRLAGGGEDDPGGETDGEEDERAADAVQEAQRDVREGYGEYDPDVDDAPPADDTRPGD